MILVLDVAAWNRLPRDGGGVRFSATVTTALGVVDGFGIGLCARYEPSEIHRGSKRFVLPSEIPSGIMFLWVT